MDDILQWLTNGKDYKTGVAVLDRHIRNKALIRHFQFSTPKCAAAKLEYELRKLLKGVAIAQAKPTQAAPAKPCNLCKRHLHKFSSFRRLCKTWTLEA